MADSDYKPEDFNAMQANMGLTPQGLAPLFSAKTPAEYATAVSQQAMFQTQQNIQMAAITARPMPTFTTGPQIYQGPGGILMPQGPAVSNQLFPTQQSNAFMSGAGFGGNRFSQGASPYQPAYLPPSSGFGQVPSPGFPFSAALPSPQFNTPFGASFQRSESAYASTTSALATTASILGGRLGSDAMTGGALGGYLGFKAGGFTGAAVGGFLGMAGADYVGIGGAGQNAFMNYAASPFVAQAGRANAVQGMSQNFLSGGGYMSGAGAGFSEHAARTAARGLTNLGGSARFETETGGRFNTQDVFRIAQESSQAGLMQGVGSPEQMVARVREVAKSLKAFMELANEPDVKNAIQTMGSMRGMGLNLGQTMDAVSQGRAFARMAGTTFQNLASQGGAIGAQTFSSMGLSQGTGLSRGMFNQGIGTAMANRGVHSAQMMNLMGGAEGYAASNTMFSGGFLQMPMMAPGMMNAQGSLDPQAIQNMMQGRTNIFDMTSRGASMLSTITGQHGMEGLGTSLALQPLLQDSLARVMTPEQQRNAENRTMMAHMRSMGYRGGGGLVMAGMQMGMNDRQALGRARELGSASYYDTLRRQTGARAQDEDSMESAEMAGRRPGMADRLGYYSSGFAGARSDYHDIGRGVDDLIGLAMKEHTNWRPGSESQIRNYRNFLGSSQFSAAFGQATGARGLNRHDRWNLSRARGGGNILGTINELTGAVHHSQNDMDLYREGGAIGSALLGTSRGEGVEAARHMGTTFGAGAAGHSRMSGFSGDVANIINGADRGSVQDGIFGAVSGNLVPGGFIRGGLISAITGGANLRTTRTADMPGQIQRAWLQRMAGSGMSQDELAARWERERPTIMRQVAADVALRTNGRGEDVIQTLAGQDAGGSSLHEQATGHRNSAYARLGMDGGSESARRDTQGFLDRREFEDAIGTGEQQQTASRRLMRGFFAASMAGVQGSSEDSRLSNRRLDELTQRASRDGFTAEQIQEMKYRAQSAVSGARSENETGISRVARNVMRRSNSADDMLSNVDAATQEFMTGEGIEQVGEGLNVMRNYHNRFTDRLFRRGRGNETENMRLNVAGMSDREISEAEQSNDPAVRQAAQAARAAKRGDSSSMNRFLADQGAPQAERRHEFEHTYGNGEHNSFRQGLNRLKNIFSEEGPFWSATTFDDWQRDHPTTGRATRSGARGIADTSQMQSEAGAEGIGGAADHLNQAATSLERVVESLREMNGERSILDRVNDN